MTIDPYDLVPYECRAVPAAHPARLATAALLKGRECAPPSRCSYLEIGCGDATNLLPLALAYPESRFVGVDRSAVMSSAGRRLVEELGLGNLELVHADVAELEPGRGPFDYVVAHGVYSWVSDGARERILSIFANELSDVGIGFLSYNTLPGWGLRGYLREVLVAHTRNVEGPREKVARAREHLARLHALRVGGERDPYAALLDQMITALLERRDGYLLHEYLAEHNRAFSVVEVIDALEAHGLQMVDDLIRATVDDVSHDLLEIRLYRDGLVPREVEAAADLLTFRQLRASLVGRAAEPRVPSPQHVFETCEMAAALRPLEPAPWAIDSEQRFEARTGASVAARTPLLRAALTLLGDAYPASIGGPELLQRSARLVAAHMPEPIELGPADVDDAFLDLMRLRGLGFVELRAYAPRFVTRAGERPLVSALNRLFAARGLPVTSALHESIALDPISRALAVLLDGTRDLAALEAALREAVRAGALDAPSEPGPLREAIATSLKTLARTALLIH